MDKNRKKSATPNWPKFRKKWPILGIFGLFLAVFRVFLPQNGCHGQNGGNFFFPLLKKKKKKNIYKGFEKKLPFIHHMILCEFLDS